MRLLILQLTIMREINLYLAGLKRWVSTTFITKLWKMIQLIPVYYSYTNFIKCYCFRKQYMLLDFLNYVIIFQFT